MKKKLAWGLMLAASSVWAQLDRSGNVIDDGGGTGLSSSLNILGFPLMGALGALVVAVIKPNLAVKPCLYIGVACGFLVEILVRVTR